MICSVNEMMSDNTIHHFSENTNEMRFFPGFQPGSSPVRRKKQGRRGPSLKSAGVLLP